MYKVEKFEGDIPKEVDHMGHHKLPVESEKTSNEPVEAVAETADLGEPREEPEAEDPKPKKNGKKKPSSEEG